MPGAFEAKANKAQADLAADLAGYGQMEQKRVSEGLSARGITDAAVGREAASQAKSGLSGAYASATAALSRAKLNATSSLNRAMSSYQQDLARMQYESILGQSRAKMGIWGALGGLGGSMMGGKK
jgi:hypothetical protein